MTKAFHVVLLTPTAFPEVTGNAMTAERWRRALSQEGVTVKVLATQHLDAERLAALLESVRPDLVHAHHATRAGLLMLDPRVAVKFSALPFVLSMAGTDMQSFDAGKTERERMKQVCHRADCIVSHSREHVSILQGLLPDRAARIFRLPKAFLWQGNAYFDLRAVAGCRDHEILFFMPAGIRPVKGNLECLRALERAHALSPNFRVLFAGPSLDEDYASAFEKEIARLAVFARRVPTIAPQKMLSAYRGADVVLNHSRSESLSNALLEAMAAGRPILASDIPGNRWLADDEGLLGPCACLFNPADPEDFVRRVLRLVHDEPLRASLAAGGLGRAKRWPNPSDEAAALLKIYEAAVGHTPGCP